MRRQDYMWKMGMAANVIDSKRTGLTPVEWEQWEKTKEEKGTEESQHVQVGILKQRGEGWEKLLLVLFPKSKTNSKRGGIWKGNGITETQFFWGNREGILLQKCASETIEYLFALKRNKHYIHIFVKSAMKLVWDG